MQRNTSITSPKALAFTTDVLHGLKKSPKHQPSKTLDSNILFIDLKPWFDYYMGIFSSSSCIQIMLMNDAMIVFKAY